MKSYRNRLPQLDGGLFLTDGGIETTLIFHEGLELPHFASFDLLRRPDGRDHLLAYYRRYALLARDRGLGFVFEAPTWRANPDWGQRIGYSNRALRAANRQAVALCAEVRDEVGDDSAPFVLSGCLGPRGDGYVPGKTMSADEAERYHAIQIAWFEGTEADMINAMTLPYAEEAIGIVRAARAAAMPVAISFTVETDGRLPSGQPLGQAIGQVDEASDGGPDYYMLNCAHPSHFADVLAAGGGWRERIFGLRANASMASHAELDEAEELDEGDPDDLAARYRELRALLPSLRVLGGCCGTDHRHVEKIADAFAASPFRAIAV